MLKMGAVFSMMNCLVCSALLIILSFTPQSYTVRYYFPNLIPPVFAGVEGLYYLALPELLGIDVHDGQPAHEGRPRVHVPDVAGPHRFGLAVVGGRRVSDKNFLEEPQPLRVPLGRRLHPAVHGD